VTHESSDKARGDDHPGHERQDVKDAWFAMRLSLLVGVVMLAGKVTAYFVTGSTAILADAAESVVHVIAVALLHSVCA